MWICTEQFTWTELNERSRQRKERLIERTSAKLRRDSCRNRQMWRKGVWPKEERKKHSEKEREGWEITAEKEKTQEKRRNLTKARASETDRWGKKRGRRHGGQTWWSSDVCLSSSHHSLFSPRLSFLCLNYRPPICFWLPLSFLACFGEGGILIHHHLKEDFTWKSSSYGLWKKLMEILRFPASPLFSMLYKWTCFRLCFFFFRKIFHL